MHTRRNAREAALQALYQCDTLQQFDVQACDFLFSVFFREELADPAFTNDNFRFCKSLLEVTIAERSAVDSAISAASTRWSIQRMARVDRNILRVAVAELLFFDDIPANVSINEAIEIAKRFGTADSPTFINGLLDRVASNASSEQPVQKVAAVR